MKKNGRLALLAIVVVLLVFPLTTSFQAKEKTPHFADEIAALLEHERLAGASVAVSVRDGATNELLFEHNGNMLLHPASSMKVLTAVAALTELGSDHTFKTTVFTDGKISKRTLHGNVYIKGGGDPTLMEAELNELAQEVRNKGIKKINGDIIADESRYDDVRLSQDLNWSDESFYTGAQVSALTLSPTDDYDAGTILVEVTPGKKAGQKPIVTTQPDVKAVPIINEALTVAAEEQKSLKIEREHGKADIRITGNVPIGASATRSWVAVWEPAQYTTAVFKQALNNAGIDIKKADETIGYVPKKAVKQAERESMPLHELLVPFLKLSNNGHGEVLVKEIGYVKEGEGSWDAGLPLVAESTEQLGASGPLLLRDGSGMSHKTLVAANDLTSVLYHAQQQHWFTDFYNGLPVAGEKERLVGGTLRNRLGGIEGEVRAKTGSLTGVSSLTGYARTNDGDSYLFTIMVNNFIGESQTIRHIEDEIVLAILGESS
ncbi:D-alanyl-D-alanine carboxypeptidase/D-alanyl-D-alanine endopeptidase [Shouchella clausii]|uniref:D-alanyl-D-alanine carboxypeptidase/D-alanyl-D-alanine endopeptidase n=1 Tax=Shouchella clausii TaxID=79880 RepID=UPI00280B893E|nr:D-alanyl-D-alanine carboxypeptidase/D-alanyl-D-alanine-endopeptidase [Shouchella clausii]WMM31220.1 D-alanyl-D-alanine carboxypeptidase/D-alanyl-D-alanine-endopeptidase [Shouchella clausii]